jgi:hypothetical protein
MARNARMRNFAAVSYLNQCRLQALIWYWQQRYGWFVRFLGSGEIAPITVRRPQPRLI